jgi:K+-transporting ATPase ATPase C chain
MTQLRPLFVITFALLVLCSFVYPGVVTAGAQALFPSQANGSIISQDGKVRGSALIGQSIQDWKAHPEYFWGRPSGASNDSSTGITYSSGSNYGPMNANLIDEVKGRIAVLRESGVSGAVPADLVTKSASGLDPHLSLGAVEVQIPRIAKVRKVAEESLRAMARNHTEGSTLGFLGEPRVNVFLLNLDLDSKAPYAAPSSSASPK